MNASEPAHIHLNNRPPCTSCGSLKRRSSENPIIHIEPTTNKQKNGSLIFQKIHLSHRRQGNGGGGEKEDDNEESLKKIKDRMGAIFLFLGGGLEVGGGVFRRGTSAGGSDEFSEEKELFLLKIMRGVVGSLKNENKELLGDEEDAANEAININSVIKERGKQFCSYEILGEMQHGMILMLKGQLQIVKMGLLFSVSLFTMRNNVSSTGE